MRNVWIVLILLGLPLVTFASVEFFALLPNPAGDDTLGEYIEIRNTGCDNIDIGGYHLYDASNKTYTIPTDTIISSHETLSFPYSVTKIALNNSGNESITLTSATGSIIDTESYSGTQGDNIVIYLTTTDEACHAATGATNTGITDSGSGSPPPSGGQGTGSTDVGNTNTGSTNSGTSNTGTTSTGNTSTGGIDAGNTNTGVTSTGSNSTGTTNTGATNTGAALSDTGILFPDIIATRQEPTNATLSGNIWDCRLNQPCRINVTFDPIFTGSFLSRNYICEVITEMEIFTTCNPNTLYFSTGEVLTFRLTNRADLSQSRSMSWEVRFTAVQDNGSTGVTSTGNTNSGILQNSDTGVTFPEIIPTFQNYTNTSNSGNILTCVTSPCRVNFTLEPIFTGSFLSRNYTCEVKYGTGVYDSCNPPQLYMISTGSIDIILTHQSSGVQRHKILEIAQNISQPNTANNGVASISQPPDTNPPIIILEFDSKPQSYYEQIDDYEFNCYTTTCALNLTAERSYDPEGGSLHFLWYYGANDIKMSRDPGGRKYGIGDHEIWLRVIDIAGNVAEIRYRIHVLGTRDKEEYKKTQTKVKKERSGVGETSGGQKKKKLKKMDFFDSPMIALQKSQFSFSGNTYICHTKTKTCSLNLMLSGAEKGILYTWQYDDGDIIYSKNPKSKSFSLGSHEVTVSASYSGSTDILWAQTLGIRVEKIKQLKKSKKHTTQKIHTETGVTFSEKKSIPIIVGEPIHSTQNDPPYATIALVSGIFPMVLLRRFFSIWK